jgi:hypothetical protein
MDGLALRARTAGWTVNGPKTTMKRGWMNTTRRGEEVMEEADEAGTSKAAPKLGTCQERENLRRQSCGLLPVNRMQQRYARIDAECWVATFASV